jgi:hypothetical protein
MDDHHTASHHGAALLPAVSSARRFKAVGVGPEKRVRIYVLPGNAQLPRDLTGALECC